ncbi:MAG: substrate-binding domain-containing protein, partial [Phycisphaerae bacterium]
PRVGLLIDTSTGFGREALQGIAEYIRTINKWSCTLGPGRADQFPEGMRRWEGDGMIVTVRGPSLLKPLRAKGLPTVNLTHELPDIGMPQVLSDDVRVGQLAAEHFADRGLRQFGYFGLRQAEYCRMRSESFHRHAESLSRACHILPRLNWKHEDWPRFRRVASEWITSVPKPIGVLAADDVLARTLVEVCHSLELRVPDDVSVVGVDNDPVFCSLVDPPLSSIDPDARRRGYEAAALLDKLMNGQSPPEEPIRLAPRALIARGSSDLVASADPDVAEALRFIRDNAHKPITVADVARAATISRRALEMRFKDQLDRLPGAELRRVRLERAQSLLVDTELDLKQIAARTGLPNSKSLCEMFRRVVGTTPMTFRKRFGNS